MAKNNESTMKWKVDIANLTKSMQEAKRQISLANAEFKNATAGMKNWQSSATGLESKLNQLKKTYDAQNTTLDLLNKKYQITVKELGETSPEAEKLKIQIQNQEAAIKKTASEMDDYNAQLNDVQKKAKDSESALGKLTQEIDDQEKRLGELTKEYKNAVLQYGENSKEAKDLKSQIEKLSGELKDNKTQMEKADKAADDLSDSLDETEKSAEDAGDGFTVMKGALASLVADAISSAISALKDMAKEMVNVGMTFDSSMSQVAAVSGATGDELEQLRDKAKEMGSTTKFTASEAADAFNYMAMAGWKTEDMLQGIDGILSLAAASGTDLATTSDIVTDALTAMGYSAKDAGHLADVMAAASSNANTNVEMMGATFQYAAPIVGSLGYDMEDTAVAIGLMANAGIKGEKAGTALRSIMTRLATDAGASSKQLGALGTITKELGVQFYNTDGTTRELGTVLEECRAAWKNLTAEQQASYGKQIAGQEALSGWLALMNAAPEDVAKLTDAVANADGAAKNMSETMMDNLGGDVTKLSSQFEGFQLTLYEKFEPALRSAIDALSDIITAIEGFVNWLDSGSVGAEAFKIAVVALTGAFAAYLALLARSAIITAFTKAIWALNVALEANPVGLVVIAIGALIAVIVYLWNKSEKFRNFFIGMWESIKETVTEYINAIKKAFSAVVTFLKEAGQKIGEFFKKIWENIKSVWSTVSGWFKSHVTEPITKFFTGLWSSIKNAGTAAWEGIKKIWSTVSEWFSKNVIEPVKKIFEPIVEWFSQLFSSIYDTLVSIVENIFGLIQGLWDSIVLIFGAASDWFSEHVIEPIAEFFTKLWNGIKDGAKAVWDKIKEIWSAVSGWFNDKIIQPVKTAFTKLWDGIKSAASTAWNAIKGVWSGVKNWFNDKIIQPVKGFFSGMWDGLKSGASKAWDGIKSVFKAVPDWFSEKFSAAWKKVKDIFSIGGKVFDGIKDGIVDAFKTVVNAIIKGINKVVSVPFNAINKVLNKIRNVSILKQKPFKNLISEISVPQIPELAEGGILKRGQIGLLEGKGAEAVIPLEKNTQWIRKIASQLQSSMDFDRLTSALDEVAKALQANLSGAKSMMTTNTEAINASRNTVQNITFKQTINSPKAVDRLTLYRQTNDMLFTAKVRMGNV